MIQRPPRSTRTDTLFPYTTLCRSAGAGALCDRHVERPVRAALDSLRREPDGQSRSRPQGALPVRGGLTTKLRRDAPGTTLVAFALASPILILFMLAVMQIGMPMQAYIALRAVICRSEDRRAGNECVMTCLSRW